MDGKFRKFFCAHWLLSPNLRWNGLAVAVNHIIFNISREDRYLVGRVGNFRKFPIRLYVFDVEIYNYFKTNKFAYLNDFQLSLLFEPSHWHRIYLLFSPHSTQHDTRRAHTHSCVINNAIVSTSRLSSSHYISLHPFFPFRLLSFLSNMKIEKLKKCLGEYKRGDDDFSISAAIFFMYHYRNATLEHRAASP